jgi:hypothetical protein
MGPGFESLTPHHINQGLTCKRRPFLLSAGHFRIKHYNKSQQILECFLKMLNKETLKLINQIEEVAYRCVIDEHYFEMVTANTEKDFWHVVQNALGDGVCIYWCHLFGSNKDNLHYSKLFNRPDVLAVGKKYSRASVKKRILDAVNYDDEQYEKFWKEVKDCRDKFVAHRENGAVGIFPHINICRLMAEELRTILSELIEECSAKSEEDFELSKLQIYYSAHRNNHLYNRCLSLYNARAEDSRNAL